MSTLSSLPSPTSPPIGQPASHRQSTAPRVKPIGLLIMRGAVRDQRTVLAGRGNSKPNRQARDSDDVDRDSRGHIMHGTTRLRARLPRTHPLSLSSSESGRSEEMSAPRSRWQSHLAFAVHSRAFWPTIVRHDDSEQRTTLSPVRHGRTLCVQSTPCTRTLVPVTSGVRVPQGWHAAHVRIEYVSETCDIVETFIAMETCSPCNCLLDKNTTPRHGGGRGGSNSLLRRHDLSGAPEPELCEYGIGDRG